jgi:4-hydroxybenzoate polyprenyltransferase
VIAESSNDFGAAVRLFLKEIRIEHTLFALPFAYTGAVFAAHGLPTAWQFAWITLAVLGARTAAMAVNRYADRKIDAKNPRTARRAVASGTLAPATMLWAAGIGIALLLLAAYELNPLCVLLLPLAALGIIIYPYCKRFTWGVHFVLGAVDGCAPLGAYVAIAGNISWAAFALFLAVTLWVAGFDIAYALMDLDVDIAQNIRSLPARFGAQSGRHLPIAMHLAMTALLGFSVIAGGAGRIGLIGVALALALTLYEARLLRDTHDVFALNDRIFVANMGFSICFLATTLAGMLVAQ